MLNVTDTTFEAAVRSSKLPVLLDFWAPWCGPCKQSMPMLEQIDKQYAGKIVVAKINADENPKVPQELSIRGLPTFILFKDGKVVDMVVGNNRTALLALVQSVVK